MIQTYFIAIVGFTIAQFPAQPFQCIRRTVADNSFNPPVPFADMVLLNTQPLLSETTDTPVTFFILCVVVGCNDFKITYHETRKEKNCVLANRNSVIIVAFKII